MATSLMTALMGSLIVISLFESAGVAKVDGFYRFPSFEFCKAERCQQDYAARKATPLESKLAKEHAMSLARRSLYFARRARHCWRGAVCTQL
jgi:hypothetical protein